MSDEMTAIKLREVAGFMRGVCANDDADLCDEAAAAIERLVAERDEARISAIDNAEVASDWSERATAAEAQRDKLKEALERIRDSFAPDSVVGSRPDIGFVGWPGFKVVARNALGDT